MVRSTRRIATKTFRELKDLIKSKNNYVSLGTIQNLKPFYVQTATEREKECCLCKFCLNCRLKYKEMIKHLKKDVEKTDSLSEYFGHGIVCPKGPNGYFQDKCVSGQCDNEECSLKVKYSLGDFDVPETIDYHQFVKEVFEYTKTKEKKQGSRTVRKLFTDDFGQFKENFDVLGETYLNHRYEIKNDQYIWPKILAETDLGYVFHMDFSENISATPKFEPQDAHFSGKQTSLHCTVIHTPNLSEKDFQYAYHFSDDKNHDASFTISMTSDLLKQFPDFDNYPLIRIKSDNCATQYCCLHVFRRYSDLAKKIGKTIILYYGVNGHGRGLVDAMSGFGVKSPLRRLIIVEEYFFNTADELCSKMVDVFAEDVETGQKMYKVIPISDLNQQRRTTKGIEIAGCQKARMISFFPDRAYHLRQRLCNCQHCSIGQFDKCEEIEEIVRNGFVEEMEDELVDLDEGSITNDLFGLTVPNTYVGLYSASNFEVFYLFYVKNKGEGGGGGVGGGRGEANIVSLDIYSLIWETHLNQGGGGSGTKSVEHISTKYPWVGGCPVQN